MPREKISEKRARAQEIEARMFSHYGPGKSSLDWGTPYQLTVAVVLAAQCTDAAVNKVTPGLWEAYPEPADLAEASIPEIEDKIKSIGLYRSKAEKIKRLAQMVVSEYGNTVPADMELLQTLPGVGRKTANCVMCEAFKDPQGIAVDTHVFRIAHRLKFAGPSANTPEKTEQALLKLYPKDQWLYINHQWVWFGREFCKAKKPLCADCFIHDLCPGAFQV